MASYNWVEPRDLVGSWLGAQPHQAEYLANRRAITASGHDVVALGRICSRVTQGPNPRYEASDVRCLVTRSIYSDRPLLIDDCNRISTAEFEELRRYQLKPFDVLVTLKGLGACKASIFLYEEDAIHSREVGVIRLRECESAPYVSAYLRSRFGHMLLRQGTLGTAQVTLATAYLKEIPICLPHGRIREHIGAKVELAEQCRRRSAQLHAEALVRFTELLNVHAFQPSDSRTNVIDSTALTDRLTSEYYLPRYFALEAHLASLGVPVKPLCSLLRCTIIRSSTPERSEGAPIPCILTSDIDPHEIRWRSPSMHIEQPIHDGHSGRLVARDVVYTSVGPPVGEAALVLPQFLPMAAGGDVSILRHGDDVHPGFLALYLNSVFGQMQNDRYSRGIRQRRVYPEDIGSFLIPVFSPEDQEYIGERIARHQVLNELAIDLVNQAKGDVEALIEGNLDVKAILAGTLKAPTSAAIPELTEEGT